MVIERAVLFAVGGVEGVGAFHLAPTGKILHGAGGAAVAMERDVKRLVALDFQRHEIIHIVYGQSHVQALGRLVVFVYQAEVGHFGLLLYGQQEVFPVLLQPHHGMVLTQHHRCDLRPCAHGGEQGDRQEK